MMFTLDAYALSSWQRCHRKWVIDRDWHPKRWRPKSLLALCLRQGLYAISNGAAPVAAAREARVRFMETAANAGLDFPGGDPYRLSKDMCAVMDVVLRCVAKLVLLEMSLAPDVALSDDVVWSTLAWADGSGQLHRWIFVDAADDGRLVSEAHSWFVAGDVMLSRMPMTLHVCEIGRMSKGRFRSPWTQAYFLPQMHNAAYHFLSPTGLDLKGAWETKYLTDDAYPDYDEWSDKLFKEGLAIKLLTHHNVKCPEERLCQEASEQVLREALEMREAMDEWRRWPMTRGACDLLSPCAHQQVCYSDKPVQIDSHPLYVRRAQDPVEVAVSGD